MKQLSTAIYCMAALLLSLPACNGNSSKTKKDQVVEAPKEEDMKEHGLTDLREADDLKTILSQTWDNEEDAHDQRASKGGGDLEAVFRGFSFFSDGTMIKNPRGSYRQGVWTLQTDKKPYSIDVKYADGSKETYQVAKADPEELTLNEVNADNEKRLVTYEGEAVSHEQLKEEPFHISNNAWRIRPAKAESEAAIRARLKGCVHFFVLFYDHTIYSSTQTVNFAGLPSCFRWYSGGIYLKKEKDLPDDWINCFYDKKQAMQAYKMAEDLLARKYTWPKGEKNWMKQNVFVLKQMEEKINN